MIKKLLRQLNPVTKYRLKLFIKKRGASLLSIAQRSRLKSCPSVTIFIVNANNNYALQLTIESLMKSTRYPNYEIWVADNNSTDGSLEYLTSLEGKVPLRVIRNTEARSHSEWLNWVFDQITTPFWIGMDNDMYFLGQDWLADMIGAMECDPDLYLVGGEHIAHCSNYVEPVGGGTVDLGERFSAYLFCMRTSLREHIHTSFAFYTEPNNATGKPLCYDTGGKLMRDMKYRHLKYGFMPSWFWFKWHHIGSLTWAFNFKVSEEVRLLKCYQMEDIKRRLESRRF